MGTNHFGVLGLGNSAIIARDDECGQTESSEVQTLLTPKLVKGLHRIDSIATGQYHTIALDQTGRVYAWGKASKGAIGVEPSAKYISQPRVLPM